MSAPAITQAPAPAPGASPAPAPSSGQPPQTIAQVQHHIQSYQSAIDAMQKVKTPTEGQLAALPRLPQMHDQEVMAGLGNWGTLLAIFGSLATREPMTAALNAAANGMRAYHQGNMDAATQQKKDFELNLRRAIETNRETQNKYIAALQAANFDMGKAKGQMSAIAAEHRDHLMQASIDAANARAAMSLSVKRLEFSAQLGLLHKKMQMQQEAQRIAAAGVAGKLAAAGQPVPPSLAAVAGMSATDKNAPDPLQQIARSVADYKFVPSSFALARPEWIRIMGMVQKMNPAWSMQTYQARLAAARNFYAGPQAQQIQSFNAVVNHLGVLRSIGDKLSSGDVRGANRLLQAVQNELGLTAPPTYSAVAKIVGQELVKAIVPGGGGEAERIASAESLAQTGSPAQRNAAINALMELAAGQLSALRTRFTATTGMGGFENFLSPAARAALDRYGAAAIAASANPGAPPVGTVEGGYRYTGGDPKLPGSWAAVH